LINSDETSQKNSKEESKTGFEPKIIGLICRWCTYGASDLAGISRMSYPSNITLVRLMCSGRVDPTFIIDALQKGADGVLISGCHLGECHYDIGNYTMTRRFVVLKKLLEQFGIEEDRVWFTYISASEAPKFVKTVKSFKQKLQELGPLNWRENWK